MIISPFRYSDQAVLRSTPRRTGVDGDVRWRLRTRGGQTIAADESELLDQLNVPGIELNLIDSPEGALFSYLRGEFRLAREHCRGVVSFDLALGVNRAEGVLVTVALYRSPSFDEELVIRHATVLDDGAPQRITINVDFDELRTAEDVYGYIQVSLNATPGTQVRVGTLRAKQLRSNAAFRALRIRFDAFGGLASASSRLRVWKFVDLLREEGHEVYVDGREYDVDLFIAQKNRPFDTVRAIRSANPKAIIVYDFDDNYLLPEQGVLSEMIAFLNIVDVVTCGSEFLAEQARRYHPNVYVLENPVDLADAEVNRAPTGELRRVGWFGAPEGLAELGKTDVAREVVTLTRGGAVEFNLATVDEDLTRFDLLLFPVEMTPWNLAKNANRMMKALGVGVPVLVSATPEQRRIHALTQLPDACLIDGLDGWEGRIGEIEAEFRSIEAATGAARQIIWDEYAPRVILDRLFQHITATTRLGKPLTRAPRARPDALGDMAVLIVDGSDTGMVQSTLGGSAVDWGAFGQIGVFSATAASNDLYSLPSDRLVSGSGSFLDLYAQVDRFLETIEAGSLLVLPAGIAPAFGMAEALADFTRHDDVQLAMFGYSRYCSAEVRNRLGTLALPSLLLHPMQVGPVAIKTRLVRERQVLWRDALDLWPWRMAAEALALRLPVAAHELPLALETTPSERHNPSRNYAKWAEAHAPAMARELPDVRKQWERLLIDMVTPVASIAGPDLPVAYAQAVARIAELQRTLAKAESDLRAARAKK